MIQTHWQVLVMDNSFEIYLGITTSVVLPWLGWITAKLNACHAYVRDLHTWHKPDDQGRQEWKNPYMREAADDLLEELRGMRKDLQLFIARRDNHHTKDKP